MSSARAPPIAFSTPSDESTGSVRVRASVRISEFFRMHVRMPQNFPKSRFMRFKPRKFALFIDCHGIIAFTPDLILCINDLFHFMVCKLVYIEYCKFAKDYFPDVPRSAKHAVRAISVPAYTR